MEGERNDSGRHTTATRILSTAPELTQVPCRRLVTVDTISVSCLDGEETQIAGAPLQRSRQNPASDQTTNHIAQ